MTITCRTEHRAAHLWQLAPPDFARDREPRSARHDDPAGRNGGCGDLVHGLLAVGARGGLSHRSSRSCRWRSTTATAETDFRCCSPAWLRPVPPARAAISTARDHSAVCPRGTAACPGSPQTSRRSTRSDAWGRPFAVLSHPHLGQVTAVIAAASDGAALVDASEVDNRVAHWGAWLADLGHEPGLVAASVTIEAAPDTGTRLRHEVEHNIDPDAPPARPRRARLDHRYLSRRGSAAMACYITLTWSTAPRVGAGKRRSVAEMALHIGQRLPGFTRTLGATGAGAARPMTTGRAGRVLSHLL